MPNGKNCHLTFPDWMPGPYQNLFCKLSAHEPPLKYPEDYGECHGATFQDSGNNRYSWWLDLTKYTHHPAEIWKDGDRAGKLKNLSDGKNVITVKSVEIVGNGDTETYGAERPFGNIWATITAGKCLAVSPLIETDDSYFIGQVLTGFRNGQKEEGYESLGFPPDIEDMQDTNGAAITILPGPYPSGIFPAGKSARSQCEFGLQWQKVTYKQGKPLLDIDDTRLPASLVGAEYYCLRVWESDGGPAWFMNDTRLLQATVDVAELKRQGSVTYAHNPIDQKGVLTGDEVLATPALFKIELEFLPEITEPDSWGK